MRAKIDPFTGLQPSPGTPGIDELFIAGTEPKIAVPEGACGEAVLQIAGYEKNFANWMQADLDWIARARNGPGTAGGVNNTKTAYFYAGSFTPYGKSWGALVEGHGCTGPSPSSSCFPAPTPDAAGVVPSYEIPSPDPSASGGGVLYTGPCPTPSPSLSPSPSAEPTPPPATPTPTPPASPTPPPTPDRHPSRHPSPLHRRPPRRSRQPPSRAPETGTRIDLNADVGEGFGPWPMGDDAGLIPLVTSVNIACGSHAGDPSTIERAVRLAVRHGVAVGAHPGYPDLVGFGRRDLDMGAEELEASLIYQVGAVDAFARDAGVTLRHVKPHGALYNRAVHDPALAATIARAVRRVSAQLVLVGLAGSSLIEAGRSAGLAVAAEAFADRAYEADGSLRSRRLAGALLPSPQAAVEQAVAIARDGAVTAHDGARVGVRADTICIHGDTPGAAAYARAVRSGLEAAGVTVAALGS